MVQPIIIYEDNDVLVIDKPTGLSVHGEGADASGTVAGWFLDREPKARGVGEPRIGKNDEEIERSGIVHRLDRDTSGVMILAKNQDAFLKLKEQFQERRVKKEYRALVYGLMRERWGTINKPIGRSGVDWRRRSAEHNSRGFRREAVTDWECLKKGEYEGEKFSYLKLRPKTGRMHQLRVHLRAVGHPIVGDNLYADAQTARSNNLGIERMALHAISLALELPNGKEVVFEAPLPTSIQNSLEFIE